MAITFVSSNVTGSITDNEHRFAAAGAWLQVGSEIFFCLPGMEITTIWQCVIMVHTVIDNSCIGDVK